MKIRLISTSEAIDETPVGKFVGNLMAGFAQLDNDLRGERVTAGMINCLESGRWPWKAPLGYLNATDASGRKVIILDSVNTIPIDKITSTKIFKKLIKVFCNFKEYKTQTKTNKRKNAATFGWGNVPYGLNK
jgi:DNA invertase Pin-like site-specific DNA recombinase